MLAFQRTFLTCSSSSSLSVESESVLFTTTLISSPLLLTDVLHASFFPGRDSSRRLSKGACLGISRPSTPPMHLPPTAEFFFSTLHSPSRPRLVGGTCIPPTLKLRSLWPFSIHIRLSPKRGGIRPASRPSMRDLWRFLSPL